LYDLLEPIVSSRAVDLDVKAGARLFFDYLEQVLRREWGVADVVRRTKSNYSAAADVELIEEAARWQVMVAGVGD
jgi:hypothetical protein